MCLIAFGVDANFTQFISDFPGNLSRRIVINKFSSTKYHLNAGELQGSVLLLFVDASTLYQWFYFIQESSSTESRNKHCMVNDALYRDLIKITEWDQANRVNLKVTSSHSALLIFRVREYKMMFVGNNIYSQSQ